MGIGTSAPLSPLMVYSGINSALTAAQVGTANAVFDGGSGSANSRVIIGSNWSGSGTRPESQLEFWNNATGGGEGNGATISTSSALGRHYWAVTTNLLFKHCKIAAATPTERMRITPNGYMGIGTNSAAAVTAGVSGPYTNLDVVGNIYTSAHTSTNEHATTEQGTFYIGNKSGNTSDGFAGMGVKVAAGNNGSNNAGIIQFFIPGEIVYLLQEKLHV